jgi:hypothetical protein
MLVLSPSSLKTASLSMRTGNESRVFIALRHVHLHSWHTNKAAGGHNQRIRPPVESRKSQVKVHMKKSSFLPAPETFTFTASSCRHHEFSCFSSP